MSHTGTFPSYDSIPPRYVSFSFLFSSIAKLPFEYAVFDVLGVFHLSGEHRPDEYGERPETHAESHAKSEEYGYFYHGGYLASADRLRTKKVKAQPSSGDVKESLNDGMGVPLNPVMKVRKISSGRVCGLAAPATPSVNKARSVRCALSN